jgi:hypothetical protein
MNPRVMHHLAKRAKQLGFQLTPVVQVAKNHAFNQSLGMCFLRDFMA